MIALLLALALAQAPLPQADEIMLRVAANQDRAEALRAKWIYHQQLHVRSTGSDHKLHREEASEFNVVPGPGGTTRNVVVISGRYLHKGKYVEYRQTTAAKLEGEDAEEIEEVRKQLTGDEGARDGLSRKLFPLTAPEIVRYNFTLRGVEDFRGTPVYRLDFEPRPTPGHIDLDTSEGPWAGTVLISRDDFEPVLVTTRNYHRVPVAMKILMGVDVKGLGYSVQYQKVADGVWFPVSYGTEYSVRVLFGWSRTITASLTNSEFRKATVDSKALFDAVPN